MGRWKNQTNVNLHIWGPCSSLVARAPVLHFQTISKISQTSRATGAGLPGGGTGPTFLTVPSLLGPGSSFGGLWKGAHQNLRVYSLYYHLRESCDFTILCLLLIASLVLQQA